MNDEFKNLLFNNFPSLYEEQIDQKLFQLIDIECQDGWFSLIETVSEVMVNQSSIIKVTKVYKKQGRLKFDIACCPSRDRSFISGVIKMAQVLSGISCEICSLQGEMFNENAIASRCVTHGGTRLRLLKRKRYIELPFNTKGIGKMWHEMLVKLFLQFQTMKLDKERSEAVITGIEIKDGKLNVEYIGGNEMTNGMVTLFLSYAEKIDGETGEKLTDF